MELDGLTRLFAYGTLLRGERNHGLLTNATFVGEARTLRGFALRNLGTYPALVRDPTETHVVFGEVYLVDDVTLGALDALEGHPDHYCRTVIPLQDGISAQAYLREDSPLQRYPIVESGSWRDRASA